MKLRKLAALGMAAIMAAGTLAGCGGSMIKKKPQKMQVEKIL